MANEDYAIIFVEIDGVLQLEELDVTLNRDPKLLPQYTVARRLAGVSAGAGDMMLDIQSAVPTAGLEFVEKFTAGPTKRQFRLVSGLMSITTDGWITKDSARHGVNKEATFSMSALLRMADWQPLPTP